jgi:group I intron endonuclease
MCGIYKITNKVDNMSYIGQSINIEERWKRHKSMAGKSELPLYRAFAKYGINNFSFEVLQECQQEQLNDLETYWIKCYDTYYNGYNCTMGGEQCGHVVKVSDEDLIKIIELLKKSNMTQNDIAKQFNVGIDTISEINHGKTRVLEDVIYPIRNNKKDKNIKDIKKKEADNNDYKDVVQNSSSKNKTPPISKDELLTLLQTHLGNFVYVSQLFNVTDNAVRKWCRKYEIPSHSFDYREKKPAKVTKPKSDQYKPCYMIDKETNEILMEFESREAAGKYLDITQASAHIGQVCNGERESAYDYKWKDKE